MLQNQELSLQEKSTKRANMCLTVTITIVSAYLMFLYLAQTLQNLIGVKRAIIIAIMLAVPPIISFFFYKKDPTSQIYRHVALISYIIVFEIACLSSTNFLYNFFMLPIMISMIMYFDLQFELRVAGINLIATLLNTIYCTNILGANSRLEQNDAIMVMCIIIILTISICLATRVAVLHVKEEMDELEARKKKQEEMMEAIIMVGKSINSSTQSIQALVEEMSDSTICVTQAMNDVAISMESTVGSIQEQAAMTGRIQDIIDDTVTISDKLSLIAATSEQDVSSGQTLVENIVEQTTRIEQENVLVKNNMAELHSHTKDMQKIIGIIQQISSQTNLLALNASIEAARAGDAGKGFAVVANEIRILSEQTKQSTQNIETIISKLNENATATISSMDIVTEEINGQVTIIHDIASNFSNIRTGLYDLKEKASDMNGKTKLLRETNMVIVDNNNNLSSTSEEVSASAEETTAMCSDNSERFKVVNNVLTELIYEAAKMDSYINEYNALHANDEEMLLNGQVVTA